MPFDPDNPFVATGLPTPKPTPQPTSPPTPRPTLNPTPPAPVPAPVTPVTPPPTPNPTPPPTAPPVPATTSCQTLDVTVDLDQYASDTTWEIIPEGQTEAFYKSTPYLDSQALTSDTQSVCLPDGTYDFIIYDVYGDGM